MPSARVEVLLWCLGVTGCSLAFTSRPTPTGAPTTCATSIAPVVIDTTVATAGLGLALLAGGEELARPDAFRTDSGRNDGTPILLGATAVAAVFGTAAIYGRRNVTACRLR